MHVSFSLFPSYPNGRFDRRLLSDRFVVKAVDSIEESDVIAKMENANHYANQTQHHC